MLNINKLHLTIKANDINSNLSNIISFHHPDLTLHTSASRKKGRMKTMAAKKKSGLLHEDSSLQNLT